MKFKYDEDFRRELLNDWKEGDRFYYLDEYPSGAFSICYVESTSKKDKDGKFVRHVYATVLKTLFSTPSAIKREEGFQTGGVWPISFYKTISDCARDGIRRIFEGKKL